MLDNSRSRRRSRTRHRAARKTNGPNVTARCYPAVFPGPPRPGPGIVPHFDRNRLSASGSRARGGEGAANPALPTTKRDKPSCFLHAVSGRIVPTGGHSAVDDDGPRDEADRLSADSQAPAGTVGAHVRTHTPTRGADRYMFLLALSTRDVGLGIG